MERRIGLASWGLIAGLALLVTSCGGGGGAPRSPEASPTAVRTPVPGEDTPTPTPLRTGSGRNERTETSDAGSITLRVQDIILLGGQSTQFSVFLLDAAGRPATDQHLSFQHSALLTVTPDGDRTRADGSLSGTIIGASGGRFALTAGTDSDSPFAGLSVTLTVVVNAPTQPSPTPSGGTRTPTVPPVPTSTPTALPCTDVQTIIVQTDTPNVSSQAGGTPKITAVVFDSNNKPVANVNVLFDVVPRIGIFNPLVKPTDVSGTAQSELRIPANAGFGTLTVSASACDKVGTVDVNVVSGVSTKPVASVVLQADPSTVGNLTGGNVSLTAAVLDGDNQPINGLDVLFITSVGRVNPLINRTKVSGAQGGIATSIAQIPPDTVASPYVISALAGGIIGSTTINVVVGRVSGGGINSDVPPGFPAAITLGASPTRIQVAGSGGTELASVVGRVFDNNGKPLAGTRVHYHVVTLQSAPGAVMLPVTTPIPSGTPTPVPTTQCAPDDPVSVSDTAGFAVIQLRAGSQPGPVTVSACTDTIIREIPSPLTAQQALVTVTSGPVDRISVTMNSRSIDNNDGSLTTTASAIVTDAQGNTVEDGTPVFFEILLRDENDPARNVVISSNSTTNAAAPCDVSQFIVQTGLPIVPQPGNAITCVKYPNVQQSSEIQIRASVGGKANGANGQVLQLPGRLGDLQVRVVPSTVSVTNETDGLALVKVSALDANLDGIENVRVRFQTSIGTIDRSVLTNVDGDATSTLTIPAGTLTGTATVRVSAGGLQVSNIAVPIVNRSGSATPTPGGSAQPAAITFLGAEPPQIGVRGSGLPEQSVLTFQVTDQLGAPVSNVPVTFSAGRIADERLSPNQDITDVDGKAQVTLTSGKRALSVQVTAQVDTPTTSLVTRSTAVNIVGGPPSQVSVSLAHQFANISGRVLFGLTDDITAFVADRFGNPVPAGTAVNFTTKGGAIGNQSPTNALGQATGTLVSQLPIPSNGTVPVLATTRGERGFLDKNGNGICDDTVDELLTVPEPFYDSNCNGVRDSGEDFIDLNDNGQFDADQGSGTPACNDAIAVFSGVCVTFSGHTQAVLLSSDVGPIPAGGSRDFTLIVSDNPDPIGNPGFGNPIVGGSQITVTVDGTRARVLGLTNLTLGDAFTNNLIIDGINRFQFSVLDRAPDSTTPEVDGLTVTVTSDLPQSFPVSGPGGNGSITLTRVLTFQSAPTLTPTISPTPTPLPTSTPTPVPPAILPLQTTLSAGTGAPPTSCNGAAQTFVVTGGSPPFTITAGGGCISVASVPQSGGTFLFTAGNLLGNFTISVTDALGKTASAGVAIQGPPTPTPTETAPPTNTLPPTITPTPTPAAAFIQLDLIDNQASSNGDGSFTTVIGALVTTATGAVVADGIEVEFSLLNPVAGESVTGIGLTNAPAPCTLGFTVVPQPGDALSCVKYNQMQAGTTVTVRARVAAGLGSFITTDRTITLPDLRPTATPARTPTPTATPVAAFIQLDLVENQASANNDGTFSTVISALVTTATGSVVGNDVPVIFSVVNAAAGVSVTSPAFTNEPPICTLGFEVVPQPGDALSCIKYGSNQAGTEVVIRAQVQTGPGTFISTQRVITLPDLRPTVTPTKTVTPTPTPTATPVPPAFAPVQATLFAAVTGCNGASKTFTLTGQDPPFTLTAGGGCLSTNNVAASGDAVTFTAADALGNFSIIATDHSGRTGAATVNVIGAPAAFVTVDLVETQRIDNGDGTFTSVVSALVTDANGITVPDGVPVEFTLVTAGGGVSVTSPGFTNQPAPCTVGVPVTLQPGDALSCIKYVVNAQGSVITVRARVRTADGGIVEGVRTLGLPDTRPTATPSNTPTAPTSTPTSTSTPSMTATSSNTPTDTATPTNTPTDTPTFTPTNTPTPTHTQTPSSTATPTETLTPSLTPSPTVTPTITPTQTATPPAGSIQFLGATPATIGVRGSGRPEQSALSYIIRNTLGQPMPGISVTFLLTGTGTESINPGFGVTNADGIVMTTVTSGTRAASVRVTAGADTNGDSIADIFAQSVGVSILGGPPAQARFSLAPDRKNIAGRVRSGLQDVISAYVNDRFGNAVPTGTAISFVSNAASVVNQTTTDNNGVAIATLLSEQVIPPTGIVTIMGFTLGEESFLDDNGDGEWDIGEPITTDNIPEPFIDFRPLPVSLAGAGPNDSACPIPVPSGLCNNAFDVSKPFELFIDTPPLNQVWGTQGIDAKWDNNVFVSNTTNVTFSGPLVDPVASPSFVTLAGGDTQDFTLEIHDDLLNPITGGSHIFLSSDIGGIQIGGSSITIPDAHSFNQLVDGVNRFHFTITPIGFFFTTNFHIIATVRDSANGEGSFVVTSGVVIGTGSGPTPTPTP